MLLNYSKIVLFICVFIMTSGCQKRYSGSQGIYSKSYKSSQPIRVGEQEIKDSPAMHIATMRPYDVFGKTYYPTIASIGETFDGIASWYGPDFHAKKTSNGEVYDMYSMTAASKTLPMNTMVKVYNKDNGKSVIVRINDRGPFIEGRIIDLSNKAAYEIDMVSKGTANVEVTVIGFHSKIAKTPSEKKEQVPIGLYCLQIGAFTNLSGAKSVQDKFNNNILYGNYKAVIIEINSYDKILHRVCISGFRSEDEANDFKRANNLENAILIAQDLK